MITILAALLFSFYFIHIAKIPAAVKSSMKLMPHERLKPFDCFTCLSVWVALSLYFMPEEISIVLIVSFGAGVIANLITRIK